MPSNDKSTRESEEKRMALSQSGSAWLAMRYPKLTILGISAIVLVMLIGYLKLH